MTNKYDTEREQTPNNTPNNTQKIPSGNMTDLPRNIWAYADTTEGYGGHWFSKPAPVDDGSDTVKYHNTEQLTESVRGMIIPLSYLEPEERLRNQALEDVIKLISPP